MYTIKQAAARVGVSVDLLRAWERRYGVVEPKRTPSGYRLYDDEAVNRLASMRRLVAAGWSPATAAATLLDPETPPPDVVAVTERTGAETGLDGGRTPASETAAEPAERFVSAASALDGPAIAAALDDMLSGRSLERSLAEDVYPSLRALGSAWSRGDVSVAGEHLASHAVFRRLAAAFEAAGNRAEGALVAVGLPPGSRHELGLLGFAAVARRNGLRVAYLGADLPLEDWISATAGAAAAVVGVPTAADRTAAEAVARGLAEARPELVIALGGRGAPDTTETAAARTLVLPADLEAAAATLRQVVAGR